MKLLDRLKKGAVGASLRYGVEGGLNEATRTRAAHTDDGKGTIGTTAKADVEVGLPVGETSLTELEEQGEVKEIFGISIEEMRLMSGIRNPYAPATLDTSKINFGEVEAFRGVRNSGSKGEKPFDGRGQLDEAAVKAALASVTETDTREAAKRAKNDGHLPTDNRRRISGRDLFEADLEDGDDGDDE